MEYLSRLSIDTRFIFDRKVNEFGEVTRHKDRLVARGLRQIEGIDYSDTHAPVAEKLTMRLLFTLAAQRGLPSPRQLDVKTACLNSTLDEEIYVRPRVETKEELVRTS